MSAEAAEKPPTLRQQIDTLTGAVEALSLNFAATQKPTTTSAPAKPTEAGTLGRCIAVLDELVESSRTGSYNTSPGLNMGAPRRILVHLAERYGVSLIETRDEPCSRAHVDSLDGYALQQALLDVAGSR